MAVWSLPTAFVSTSLVPWLGRLAAVTMLAVLAWTGANIFWTLTTANTLAPLQASTNTLETDPRKAAQLVVARHVFGEVAAVAAVVAEAPTDIRLSGIIAAQRPGQTAMAILALEGKPAIAVREGEEFAPGLTLQRVQERQVELLRGSQTQILGLPEPNKSASQPGKPTLPQAAAIAQRQVASPAPQPSTPSPRRGRYRRRSSASSESD